MNHYKNLFTNCINPELNVKIHHEESCKLEYNPREIWKNNIINHQSLKDFFLPKNKWKNKKLGSHLWESFLLQNQKASLEQEVNTLTENYQE